MTTRIIAKAARFIDDGYCTVLGFADDAYDPASYVILQMTNEPDEQDLKLRLGGVHIEVGDQRSGYDLVEDIRETNTVVVVNLRAGAARKLGVHGDIEIELESRIIDGIPAGEAVGRFKERLSSWDQRKAGLAKAAP
jgi:hypothetical protein